MKTRNGFVSNSSSSSFVIGLAALSAQQLSKIMDHEMLSRRYGLTCDTEDRWSITINDDTVEGYTSMDNFNMKSFLDMIGVDKKFIMWSYS